MDIYIAFSFAHLYIAVDDLFGDGTGFLFYVGLWDVSGLWFGPVEELLEHGGLSLAQCLFVSHMIYNFIMKQIGFIIQWSN